MICARSSGLRALLRNHYRAMVTDLVRDYEAVKLRNVEQYAAALRELGVAPPATVG